MKLRIPPKTDGLQVRFVGYVEYRPTHFHPEFIVSGHVLLPDASQVSADTLRALRIPVPPIPDCFGWRRQQLRIALSWAQAARKKNSWLTDLLCFWQHKKGEFLGNGQVIVTGKKNKPQATLDGRFDVYQCGRCLEPFSEPQFRSDNVR